MNKKIEQKNYSERISELHSLANKEWCKIYNSKEFKLNQDAMRKKERERYEIVGKIKNVRLPILKKYLKDCYSVGIFPVISFDVDNIKSEIKKGIKNGLGVKYICHIGEDDLKKITIKLIEEEFASNKEDIELLKKEKVISQEFKTINEEREKMYSSYETIKQQVNDLIAERDEYNLRHDNQIIATRELVKQKLNELMPKIKEEVTRELVAGALD